MHRCCPHDLRAHSKVRWAAAIWASFAAGLLLTASGVCQAAELKSLEEQFLDHARPVIQTLRQRGHKTVGVLKFQIQKEGYPRQDSVGSLNLLAAERFETALGLENPNEVDQQIVLLRRASDVASKIAGALTLTGDGRRKLFEGRYPPAFGRAPAPIEADAFVSGIITVDPKLTHLSVRLISIESPGDKEPYILANFRASIPADKLIEIDESMRLRGLFDGGEVQQTAIAAALEVREKPETAFPLLAADAPVRLTVTYDQHEIPLEFRDGRAFVPEPTQTQKVSFQVKRNGAATERLAFVLKVNGENTLFGETCQDRDCSLWVLEPGVKGIIVKGYQADGEWRKGFKVASASESEALAMNFGADNGTISLAVFREMKEAPSDISERAEDIRTIGRAPLPMQTAASVVEWKGRLRTSATFSKLKGIVIPGEIEESPVDETEFRRSPTPILTASIRYYAK